MQVKLFCQNYTAFNKSILGSKIRQFEQDFLHIDVEEDGADAAEMLERNKFLLRNLLEERAQEKIGNRKNLCHLKLPDGREVTDDCGIISHPLSFYEDLYKAESCDAGMADSLLQDLPRLADEEKHLLDQPLTFDYFTVAVNEFSPGKAPGLDGLSAEF